MGIYEGRLTRAEIKRAGENGEYLEQKGRNRGGKRFFGGKWITFNSDEVDMQSILAAAEEVPAREGPMMGKLEPGELEIRLVEGKPYKPPEPPKPPPGIVGERPSDEVMAKAREEEIEARKTTRGGVTKKPGRPKKVD